MSKEFNKTVAKEIALKQFGHTLDCVLGYSDPNYSLKDDPAEFEQNFAEDLEEKGMIVTDRRIQVICNSYKDLVQKFEKRVRKMYPTLYKPLKPQP